MSLAKTMGVFRLTRDIELTYTATGTAIAKMGLVCSEKYKDRETTLFLDAVAFGKTGEIINQYAGAKGTQIYIVGKLQTDQWVDQNNQKRNKISMVVESFDFIGSKSQNQNAQPQQAYQPQQQQAYPQQRQAYQPQQQAVPQQQAYQPPAPTYEQQQNDGSYKPVPPPQPAPLNQPAVPLNQQGALIDDDEIPFAPISKRMIHVM